MGNRKTIQLGCLEITTTEHGSVWFKNDKNSFFCTPEEIKQEIRGNRFHDSLKFACRLLSIATPMDLLNAIDYQFLYK